MCQVPPRRRRPGILLRVGAIATVLKSAELGFNDPILAAGYGTPPSTAKDLKWIGAADVAADSVSEATKEKSTLQDARVIARRI
jgi:hypothetical protein